MFRSKGGNIMIFNDGFKILADHYGFTSQANMLCEEAAEFTVALNKLRRGNIVTDALTAMGYSAKDAGRLADVMAAASSNANTNVEMMGQTFKYAAPIVGTLGYSMEDTAVAIGLMANAGIKADQAGTSLRSVLTRLSAPPKECAEEMENLGISMTDSEGKMKSLDQIMIDLRKAFSNLSETEQTAAAKHIAGANAMSGLLAIVNAAPEDYNKLTDAVKNSEGANEAYKNVKEELADVLIVALQLRLLLGPEEIDRIAEEKVNRQLRRIESEEQE